MVMVGGSLRKIEDDIRSVSWERETDGSSVCSAASDCVIDHQHDDRADNSDEHAVEVEARDGSRAELGEQEATHDRADDAQHDVKNDTFALLVDDLAGNEASDEP